jgi:hypothetical protein
VNRLLLILLDAYVVKKACGNGINHAVGSGKRNVYGSPGISFAEWLVPIDGHSEVKSPTQATRRRSSLSRVPETAYTV